MSIAKFSWDASGATGTAIIQGEYTPPAGDTQITNIQTDITGRLIVAGGSDANIVEIGGNAIGSDAGASTAGTLRTVTASDSPEVTALQIIDDWDEGDRAKVNVIVGQAGITAGVGAVAANTPRVTHASDDPVTTSVQIMDDWDESDRAKVNLIAAQAGITGGNGAVAANTPRVTHASDDPVTTAVQIMDDWDESDRCKVNINLNAGVAVSVNSGATDAGTIRVTLATDGPIGSCTNTDDSAIGTKGLSIVAKAKTAQRAAVADVDAVQIVSNEYGELVVSGHTWATRSIRCEEIDPLDQKYVGETIAVVTNATGAPTTYNYYVDMGGYTSIGFQWVLSFSAGSTIKVYGSLQDDGTAPASCSYSDLTTALWGVASITASGTNFDTTGTLGLCKYVKIEVIIGVAGSGADDYTIYCKRAW